jgi:hypothetical protein
VKRQLFLIWLLFLVACGTGSPAPESGNDSDVAPGQEAAPQEGAPIEIEDIDAIAKAYTSGDRNENGTFFRGKVDAPVTMLDYSDFL